MSVSGSEVADQAGSAGSSQDSVAPSPAGSTAMEVPNTYSPASSQPKRLKTESGVPMEVGPTQEVQQSLQSEEETGPHDWEMIAAQVVDDLNREEGWAQEEGLESAMSGMCILEKFIAIEQVELNNNNLRELLQFAMGAGMLDRMDSSQVDSLKVLSREDTVQMTKLQLHR